jgi:hypothetical protein
MSNNLPEDLIKVKAARELLGVSHAKMAKLLAEGVIPHWTSPLDARIKLVSKAHVLQLKIPRTEAA